VYTLPGGSLRVNGSDIFDQPSKVNLLPSYAGDNIWIKNKKRNITMMEKITQ
jgi:hypothetical protein